MGPVKGGRSKELNAEGVPGPGSHPWSDTTSRGDHTRRTGILHNELNIGRLVWNRQRCIKGPSTGNRIARPNSENEWIVQEVAHLRIIDQDLWDKAQAKLANIRTNARVTKAREKKFWEKRRAKHLLTGLARCGVCSGTYASVGRDYLARGNARRQGACSNKKSIPRPELENLILDGLRSRLMAPDLVKVFVSAFHQEWNAAASERNRHQAARRHELEQVSKKLEGLIDAIAGGLRSDSLQEQLDRLEGQKKALAANLGATAAPAPRFHPNLAELYRQKVERLQESLADPKIRLEAMEILRGLVETVILRPAGNGWRLSSLEKSQKCWSSRGVPGAPFHLCTVVR